MGYIKLDRKFKDWKWKNKPNMVAVWIHLLLEANYVENTFENIEIPVGSLVTSIKSIAEKTGLTIQQTRTCISNLQITNEITIKSTNKYSIITINKWAEYQSNGKNQQTKQQAHQIKTNNQITNELTTLKEYKEIKKEEYINNTNNIYSTELSQNSSMQTENYIFKIPLNVKNTYHYVTQEEIDMYKDLYPDVDIEQSYRSMIGWCDANPRKLKTKNGIKRFINTWLSKEQDRGGSLSKEERELKMETQRTYIKDVNRKLEKDKKDDDIFYDTN